MKDLEIIAEVEIRNFDFILAIGISFCEIIFELRICVYNIWSRKMNHT